MSHVKNSKTDRKIMEKDKKMKLTFVLNTEGGVKRAGCRASGVYKGYHIERTATCPYENFPDMQGQLEMVAKGRYNAECRTIDAL